MESASYGDGWRELGRECNDFRVGPVIEPKPRGAMQPGTETVRDHLFISYASEDAVFVDWLALRLAGEGYKVWYDRIKLLGGESYPRDVDDAIKDRTFRFLAILSRHSLRKPNPVKERTLALNIARARGEDFVIPINLDGIPPDELDWMHSDLTFIAFSQTWSAGLRQLLAKLEQLQAPRFVEAGRGWVREWCGSSESVVARRETLRSNLAEILEVPQDIYRYELGTDLSDSEHLDVLKYWPHFREDRAVCWTFQLPPPEICEKYRLAARGRIEDWRTARGIDVNVRNVAVRVFNASIRSLCLKRGLVLGPDGETLYWPNQLVPNNRFSYMSYDGRSWLQPVGVRTFRTKSGRQLCRYHLAPSLRVWLDRYEKSVVHVALRLFLTDLEGTPLAVKSGRRRRKMICRSWWNHEWLCRMLAVLQFMAGDKACIEIGNLQGQQLVIAKQPLALATDRAIDEATLAREPALLPSRCEEEEELAGEEEEDEGDTVLE
jgi:hypothetical protein